VVHAGYGAVAGARLVVTGWNTPARVLASPPRCRG
jgi:hypothetical protein